MWAAPRLAPPKIYFVVVENIDLLTAPAFLVVLAPVVYMPD